MMQRYPAAERLAQQLVLEDDVDLDAAVDAWRADYVGKVQACPSSEEVTVARRVLAERLDGCVPPLPPSASSSAWRFRVDEIIGLPTDTPTRKA